MPRVGLVTLDELRYAWLSCYVSSVHHRLQGYRMWNLRQVDGPLGHVLLAATAT